MWNYVVVYQDHGTQYEYCYTLEEAKWNVQRLAKRNIQAKCYILTEVEIVT